MDTVLDKLSSDAPGDEMGKENAMLARHRLNDRDHGQVMVLFALFSFVLVGALALALDAGYLMSERRHAQAAADAGALAGARRLMSGDGDEAAKADALSYVEANDIDLSAGAGPTASVSVDGDKNNGTVTVNVTVPVTKFFIGALYTGDWEVSARAVAEINDNTDGQAGLVALEEPGMGVRGAPRVRVIDGGAFSNGDVFRAGEANAFIVDTMIEAVGSIDSGSLWYAPDGFNTARPTMDDPLGGAIPPDPGTLEEREAPDCENDCVLMPGYYANMDIRIKGIATLEPGLYYFHNTRIRLMNTNSRIEGEGVMLYFAGTSSFEPKNGSLYLTAPAESPYAEGIDGMTVWIANCSKFEGPGNQEFYIKGIFYAPCSDVWMYGNPYGVAISGQVIVGTLEVRGTADFIVEYVGYVRTPRPGVFLIE